MFIDAVRMKRAPTSSGAVAVPTRIDAMQTRIDTMQTRIDAMKTRIDTIKTRIDAPSPKLMTLFQFLFLLFLLFLLVLGNPWILAFVFKSV